MKIRDNPSESKRHLNLKKLGIKKLREYGCSNIIEEFPYFISGKKYIFDVVGFKEDIMYIVECGNIASKDKLEFIKKMKKIEFIHLKYSDYPDNTTKRVRVIIGNAVKGDTGIRKPTHSILIEDTNVKEIYNKIKEMIRKEGKKK